MNNGDVYIGIEIDPLEVMSEQTMHAIMSDDPGEYFINTGYVHWTFPVHLLRRIENRVDEKGKYYTATVRTWWLCAGRLCARHGITIHAERMKKFLSVVDALTRKKSNEISAFFVSNT